MKDLLLGRAAVPAFVFAMLLGTPALPAAAQNANVTVVVNGQTMSFDQPPVEQAGRVYVPLRSIFQQLGASVVYQNGAINATGDGRNISLRIGSNQAMINGQAQTLDSPPFVQGSRTLVPLRFVAQALGAAVDWNNNTSTVTITGGNGNRGYNGYNGNNGNNGNGYNRPAPPPMNANRYLIDAQPIGAVQGTRPTVSGRFAVPVRRNSIRITLDGGDITNDVYLSAQGFRWTPRGPLGPGRHLVRITGVTRDGASFSTGWSFRI